MIMQKIHNLTVKEIFLSLIFFSFVIFLVPNWTGAWSGNPANSTNPGGWGGDNLTSDQISSWANNSSWTGSTSLYSGSGGGSNYTYQGGQCQQIGSSGNSYRCYCNSGGNYLASTYQFNETRCPYYKPPSPPPPPPPSVTAAIEVRNITVGTNWTGSNIVIDPTDEIALRWSSTNATSCSGSNFNTGGATNNSTDSVTEPDVGTYVPYSVICYGGSGQAGDSLQVSTRVGTGADISVEDGESIVHSGDDVTLDWDVGTSDPSACEIRIGNNTVTGYSTLSSATGSFAYTVTAESTFTLDCESGVNVDTQTITVLPEFQET